MLAPDTAARIAAIALDAAEDILDELIALPEPLETISDHGIHELLTENAGWFRKDPARMRKRADKAEAKGKHDKAPRIRENADRIEAIG